RRHTRFSRDWSSDVCSSDLRCSRRPAWARWCSSATALPPAAGCGWPAAGRASTSTWPGSPARSACTAWRRGGEARARLHPDRGAGGVHRAGAGADLPAGHALGRHPPGALVGRCRARRAARAFAAGRGRRGRGARARARGGRAGRRPLPLAARGGALGRSAAAARCGGGPVRAAPAAPAARSGLGRWRGRAAPGAGVAAPGAARSGGRGVAMRARTAGFTLIEVLAATVLLAAGLALGFATLRAATATAERGEAMAARTERMRAVEGFLRKRLAAAAAISFGRDEGSGRALRFIGEPDRIRFVADLPGYLGRGGPHLHDIAVHGEGREAALAVSFTMVLAGETIDEQKPRPPEPLVEGLTSLRIRYRGRDEQGPTDWL